MSNKIYYIPVCESEIVERVIILGTLDAVTQLPKTILEIFFKDGKRHSISPSTPTLDARLLMDEAEKYLDNGGVGIHSLSTTEEIKLFVSSMSPSPIAIDTDSLKLINYEQGLSEMKYGLQALGKKSQTKNNNMEQTEKMDNIQSAEEAVLQNARLQKEQHEMRVKANARVQSLLSSPMSYSDKNGLQVMLTATERVKEAEVIYNYLTQDIKE